MNNKKKFEKATKKELIEYIVMQKDLLEIRGFILELLRRQRRAMFIMGMVYGILFFTLIALVISLV